MIEAAMFDLNRRSKSSLGLGAIGGMQATLEILLTKIQETGAGIAGKVLWAVTDDNLYIWDATEKILKEKVRLGDLMGSWELDRISVQRVPDRDPSDRNGSGAVAFEDDRGTVVEMKAEAWNQAALEVIRLLCGTEALDRSGGDPFAAEHEQFRNQVIRTNFGIELVFFVLFGVWIYLSDVGPLRPVIRLVLILQAVGATAVMLAPLDSRRRKRLEEILEATFFVLMAVWGTTKVVMALT